MNLSAWQFRLLLRILCWSATAFFLVIAIFIHTAMVQPAESDSLVGIDCVGRVVQNEVTHHQKVIQSGKTSQSWDMPTSRVKVSYQFNGHDYSGERNFDRLILLRKDGPVQLMVDPHHPSRWEFKPGQGAGLDAPPQVDHMGEFQRSLSLACSLAALCASFILPGMLAPESKHSRLEGLS